MKVYDPVERTLHFTAGLLLGMAAQSLFAHLVGALIGPIPEPFSGAMLVWILLLAMPPILSYTFLVIQEDSPAEYFYRGFQVGALVWFLGTLATFFLSR